MKGAGGAGGARGGWRVSTRCRWASMSARLLWAWAPHSMKTAGWAWSDTWRMTAVGQHAPSRGCRMAGRLALFHSQARVEQQNAFAPIAPNCRPGSRKFGGGRTQIALQFLEDIAQRRWKRNARAPLKTPAPRPDRARGRGPGPVSLVRTASGGVSCSARKGCGGKIAAPACSTMLPENRSKALPSARLEKPAPPTAASHAATGQSAGSAASNWSATDSAH